MLQFIVFSNNCQSNLLIMRLNALIELLLLSLLGELNFSSGTHATSEIINDLQCGISSIDASPCINGGERAPDMAYLWIASLHDKSNYHYCGATLIAPKYLLSAAHCFFDCDEKLPQNFFQVTLGVNDRFQANRIVKAVKSYWIHGHYNSRSKSNDIALLKIAPGVNFWKTHVKPICLPTSEAQIGSDQEDLIIAGWGFTDINNGRASDFLNHIKVPAVSHQQCAFLAWRDLKINVSKHVICSESQGKDSCYGDSGGPVMREDKKSKRIFLIGIVSTGAKNCDGWSLNTKVPDYMKWIKNRIKKSNSRRSGYRRIP